MTKRTVTIAVDDENGLRAGEENKEEEDFEAASTPPFLQDQRSDDNHKHEYNQEGQMVAPRSDLDDEHERVG
jgi:hypothetical protein